MITPIRLSVFSLIALTLQIPALAQVATPTPADDVHPYQSQTMVRYTNGLIQTIPSVTVDYRVYVPEENTSKIVVDSSLLYDKENPLPAIQGMGANYAYFKGGFLATISADGFLNPIGKANYEPAVYGGVYFTKKGTNELVLIDSYGSTFETGMIAPAIRMAGGNYFIDQNGTLTTIRSMGSTYIAQNDGKKYRNFIGMMTEKQGWSFADAKEAGGNFFVKTDGTLITINSLNGFFSEPFKPASKPVKLGGNYFVGEDNFIYSVSFDGVVSKAMQLKSRPTVYGYSYLQLENGSMVVIDFKGKAHDSVVRVSPTGVRSEIVRKFSGPFDPATQYLPGKR